MTTTAVANLAELASTREIPGFSREEEVAHAAINDRSYFSQLVTSPEKFLEAVASQIDNRSAAQLNMLGLISQAIGRDGNSLSVTGQQLTERAFCEFVEAAAVAGVSLETTERLAVKTLLMLKSRGASTYEENDTVNLDSETASLQAFVRDTHNAVAASMYDLSSKTMFSSEQVGTPSATLVYQARAEETVHSDTQAIQGEQAAVVEPNGRRHSFKPLEVARLVSQQPLNASFKRLAAATGVLTLGQKGEEGSNNGGQAYLTLAEKEGLLKIDLSMRG